MAASSIPADSLTKDILSNLIIYGKYAKYLPDKRRRETWDEIVDRCLQMHLRRYPHIEDQIRDAFQFVREKKVLPSMRSMQFAGKPIDLNAARQYNCSFVAVNHWEVFSEIMFLLLGGTGVGYSVQRHHVEQLPEVKKHINRKRRYLINDSIEGWADAIKVLAKSYFFGLSRPIFDYRDIRPRGTPLKTAGGRAPGPQPIKDCIHNLKKIFDAKPPGTKLTPLEVHDIICYIADAVLAGGIRRAATIALFSIDDQEMLTCKYGNWWELNPQRGRANNSAVILRHKITKKKFMELWERIKLSGSGEPGLLLSHDKEWGSNPCGEVSLRNTQFCNLTTVNCSTIQDQADLNARAKAAAFIGTLQAGYTDFHYLRDRWQDTTEKEALLGVSLTGIASGTLDQLDLTEAAELVVQENQRIALEIGINPAARTTLVKPEGTTSLVLGCSSGIHPWYAKYYIRRVTLMKDERLYLYLKQIIPELIEDNQLKASEAFVCLPIAAPAQAITREESALSLLERVKKVSMEWVRPGHLHGDNTHNVSATIYVKDHEWDAVAEWMWENRSHYNGLTVLPTDSNTYNQTPFEEIDEAEYLRLCKYAKKIDLTQILEEEDNTKVAEEVACGGGNCEIAAVQ